MSISLSVYLQVSIRVALGPESRLSACLGQEAAIVSSLDGGARVFLFGDRIVCAAPGARVHRSLRRPVQYIDVCLGGSRDIRVPVRNTVVIGICVVHRAERLGAAGTPNAAALPRSLLRLARTSARCADSIGGRLLISACARLAADSRLVHVPHASTVHRPRALQSRSASNTEHYST